MLKSSRMESKEVRMRHPSLSKRLGHNLARRRRSLGLTQAQVAARMQVEPETVSRFERGVSLPALLTLEKLATVLDTTMADLLDEHPGAAYPESRQIAAQVDRLNVPERRLVLAVVRPLCKGLAQRSMR